MGSEPDPIERPTIPRLAIAGEAISPKVSGITRDHIKRRPIGALEPLQFRIGLAGTEYIPYAIAVKDFLLRDLYKNWLQFTPLFACDNALIVDTAVRIVCFRNVYGFIRKHCLNIRNMTDFIFEYILHD